MYTVHDMYYILLEASDTSYVMYFKIKQNLYSILNLVGATMFCKGRFPFVSFITLVAFEWSLHGMRLHVSLQSIRSSASVVALVTFEWFLLCVHPHHMSFQIARSNARILARGAPLWLFSRVCSLVVLQVV